MNLNAALQWTGDEQLLLNLVRLRYRDTPAFLEVSSISTQLRLEASLQVGADLERNNVVSDLFRFLGTTGYSTQPTLTYTPLQGENLAQRLLSPLTLEKLVLLHQSGWNVRRLFRLCVQRLGDVPNAPRASGPTPEEAPEYKEFARVLELLRQLERKDALKLGYESYPPDDGRPRPVLQVSPRALQYRETQELLQILRLTPGGTHYPLVYPVARHALPGNGDSLAVETRSLLGMLYYLAQAVEVPDQDRHKGKVIVTRDDAGEPFDWNKVLGNSLMVRSQPFKPAEAATAVRYRGMWFYIDDADLESKATFSILSQIFALQAGKSEAIIPVLTLPIGR